MASTAGGGPGGAAGDETTSQLPMGSRASSGSGRSASSRGAPDKQLSQIEKSVTHLLVATKQLLETLTQWSRQQASESEVSDVYVRLGYEFNLACRAFGAIGVETTDLGPVPDLLRTILEDTLSQDASPESLDRYLPRIRDIIINLLHGLKKKQAKLRSRQGKEARSAPPRQGSSGSVGSGEASLNQMLDEAPPRSPQKRVPQGTMTGYPGEQGLPRNNSSSWSNDRHGGTFAEREASKKDVQRSVGSSSSSLSSNAMQNMPVLPPYSDPTANASHHETGPSYTAQNFPHPPPPTPPTSKQDDAIGLLQRSGELERRASRRFSAYQISKHLGPSPNGVPVIPPTQNSPVPNRGRDVRESMNAVRLRGSHLHGRQRSNNHPVESSPGKAAAKPEREEPAARPRIDTSVNSVEDDSPMAKTPSDKIRSPRDFESRDAPVVGGSLPNLPQIAERSSGSSEPYETPENGTKEKSTTAEPESNKTSSTLSDGSPSAQFTPESSPPPGKELTLFLQYKSKIKKYVLPEGYSELTIGRLQLAFIEKFAWNTHSNGADLPEIYIQDPVSGVRHELEDLSDVKDRSVLVLNVEALDEVKKHFDEGVGGIRRLIEGVREIVDGQGTSIQRLSERQLEASKEMSRLATARPQALPTKPMSSGGPVSGNGDQIAELQSIRRDLATLRQTYTNFTSDISASMSSIRSKAGSVKSAATEMTVPSYEGDAGRARVNAGKKELADESERIVARVDDLQDLVEDLRKDVVTRGVRPLPRQLEAVGRDISAVTKELKKMQEFLKREKPIWTKIWEKELQLVCEERDQLTMQEDLAVDLEDDLEKAAQTFALVEQATKEQSLHSTPGPQGLRNASRNFPVDETMDPMKAKDHLLGEVRALQPNHEDRVEAIERAEKARQKELENRRVGLFQKELGKFVEEGKLKKSGGVEEAERMRKVKDDRIRKEVWERQQGRNGETEKNAAAEPSSDDKSPPQDVTESAEGSSSEQAATHPDEAADDGASKEETTSPSASAAGT
ncbi:Bud site selection protein 6 [Onygenales sp. PD_40]|nr:Bud site selection protein 6 [Onygenales sp. PD_40]